MRSVLAEDGTAGIIVSNRFMTTKSGASVPAKEFPRDSFHVRHRFGISEIQNSSMQRYSPQFSCFSKRRTSEAGRRPSPASTRFPDSPTAQAQDPINALKHTGTVAVQDGRCFRIQHGTLSLETHKGDIWRVATDTSDAWLATVKAHTWGTLADIGNIRAGIKTCGDKVFIRSDWSSLPEDQKPELLRPLTTHHNARRFRPDREQRSTKVVYPHAVVDVGRPLI